MLNLLKKMKKSIYNSIGFALIIINPKILLKKLRDPTNLFKALIFYIQKLIKVVIVDKNQKLLLLAF